MISAPRIAVPIRSSRYWANAVTPNDHGGWNFITQSYQYPTAVPSEWVVVDLENATSTITLGPVSIITNSNYVIPNENQLTAPNGRIFFPGQANHIAYYDPDDELIHQVPQIVDPVNGEANDFIFRMNFNVDGSTLYGTCQVPAGSSPMVFRLDTETLATEILGYVGDWQVGPTYGYYIWVDETPASGASEGYVYVAVGQNPWQLVALNINTGDTTTLATTTGPGTEFIEIQDRAGLGLEVTVTSNSVQTNSWLDNGALTPWPGSGAPTTGARTTTPHNGLPFHPPQIDYTFGIGQVRWRPYGSSGDWTEVTYDVNYISPVPIESLLKLDDGVILGNVQQYQGFFKYDPATKVLEDEGAVHLVSQPVYAFRGDRIFITGYPNGILYNYDPASPWETALGVGINPAILTGNFHTAGATEMKYPYFFVPSSNGRLYCCGRRERDGNGTGIGYYNPDTATFGGGTFADPLNFFDPEGFLVLDDVSLVVFSGDLHTDPDRPGEEPDSAQIITYDLDMNEVDRFTPIAGLATCGLLYPTSTPGEVFAITNEAPTKMYRYNVQTGTLVDSVALGVTVGASTARADGKVLVMLGTNLVKIDPDTLTQVVVGDLSYIGPAGTVAVMAAVGKSEVYLGAGATLRKINYGRAAAGVKQQ